MGLRDRVRSWLGISEVQEDQALLAKHIIECKTYIQGTLEHVKIHNAALARCIALGDKAFLKDPYDPKVREESDEIGDKVIERLKAEQAVLGKYGYSK